MASSFRQRQQHELPQATAHLHGLKVALDRRDVDCHLATRQPLVGGARWGVLKRLDDQVCLGQAWIQRPRGSDFRNLCRKSPPRRQLVSFRFSLAHGTCTGIPLLYLNCVGQPQAARAPAGTWAVQRDVLCGLEESKITKVSL